MSELQRRKSGRRLGAAAVAISGILALTIGALYESAVQNAFGWLIDHATGGSDSEILKVEPFPGEVTMTAHGAAAPHLVVPRPLQELERLPPPQKHTDASFLEWGKPLGGIRANDTVVSVQIRSGVPEAIVITNLRIEVVKRGEPIPGTYIAPAGAGDLYFRILSVDLDAQDVAAVPSSGESGEWDFPLQVGQQSDTEVLTAICRTRSHYVEFFVLLDYVYHGRKRTLAIKDGGQPFKVTGDAAATETAIFSTLPNGQLKLVPYQARR